MSVVPGVVDYKLPVPVNCDQINAGNYKDRMGTQNNISETGFEISTVFYNGMPYPVTIAMRNGTSVTLPSVGGNWRSVKGIVVQVKFRFPKNVSFDVQRILDEVSDKSPMELKALKEALADSQTNIVQNGHLCLLTYAVSREQFESHGAAIYINQLDVTIAKDKDVLVTVHPASAQGERLTALSSRQVAGFTYALRINDPHQSFGDRFCNIGGRVYRVPTICRLDIPPGVYARTTGSGEGGISEETHYDFDVADAELLLFQTSHDARTLGNILESRKREFEERQFSMKQQLSERELENKQTVLDMDRQLNQMKLDKAEWELAHAKEIQRLKEAASRMEQEGKERDARYAAEKAERERRAAADKEHYERRSAERKDFSELIKWIPVTLIGIGIIVSKFNNKPAD